MRNALQDCCARRRVEALNADELRQLVQEGIESGPSLDADAVFGGLRARYEIGLG